MIQLFYEYTIRIGNLREKKKTRSGSATMHERFYRPPRGGTTNFLDFFLLHRGIRKKSIKTTLCILTSLYFIL